MRKLFSPRKFRDKMPKKAYRHTPTPSNTRAPLLRLIRVKKIWIWLLHQIPRVHVRIPGPPVREHNLHQSCPSHERARARKHALTHTVVQDLLIYWAQDLTCPMCRLSSRHGELYGIRHT
jgi:hypothetical protein